MKHRIIRIGMVKIAKNFDKNYFGLKPQFGFSSLVAKTKAK